MEEFAEVFGNNDPEAYERIGRTFPSGYNGSCTIDYDHRIRRGDVVSKVQKISNPMVPVSGVACASCTKVIPHA